MAVPFLWEERAAGPLLAARPEALEELPLEELPLTGGEEEACQVLAAPLSEAGNSSPFSLQAASRALLAAVPESSSSSGPAEASSSQSTGKLSAS